MSKAPISSHLVRPGFNGGQGSFSTSLPSIKPGANQPDDPIAITRQSNWGQDQLAKVPTLTRNENHADHETGRPVLYDNAIDTDYTHSIGIQKGHI
ncbi:hypothetical protein CAURIS_05530 [Corynebacterium auris]|nr:hypothetical protein CAURIS_05530 [Corynebacterium auris]